MTAKRLFQLALALFVITLGLQLWSNPDPGIVDLELAFTEDCASKIVKAWGDAGTERAKLNLKLDFPFIVGYVSLLWTLIALAMGALRRRLLDGQLPFPPWLSRHGHILQRLAVVAGLLDALENLLLIDFLKWEILPGPALFVAGCAAVVKFAILASVVVAFCVTEPAKSCLIDLGSVLRICRANVIVLLVGWAFLLLVPQGRDVVHTLGEPPLPEKWFHIFLFFLAVALWAWNVWYWARVMLRFNWPLEPSAGKGRSGWAEKLREHVPRALGVLAVLAVAAAFDGAARAATDADTKPGHQRLFWITCALGLLFYAFVYFRRRWAATKQPGPPPPTPLRSYSATLTKISQLGRKTLLALAILEGVTVALFVLFSINPGLATSLGSAAVVLFAAAAWVPFGALLVYVAQRYEVPLLTLLAAGLVVFSYLNDNHPVRKISERNDLTPPAGVEKHFRKWLDERPIGDASADSPYPVVIVAAEGGGIRAAYWTATVLSRLQDQRKTSAKYYRFSDHVYAISGVSGGSLGAAAFAALVREQNDREALPGEQEEERQQALACPTDGDGHPRGPFETCAHQMLKQDFLSPTAAALLYPDLVQRFLFFPVNHFSRGRALETAWEEAWNGLKLTQGRFGAEDRFSFRGLWRDDERSTDNLYRVPLLFLNTTRVETGQRALFSPLPVGKLEGRDTIEFQDTIDLHAIMVDDVRLSTAAHASARFTFVSPAGTVRDKDGKVWGHVVDGGYFENSGATTALEILRAMRAGAKTDEGDDLWPRIRPIVLMITNAPNAGAPEPRRFLKEALSPVVALLQTRNARGSYSKEALREAVGDDLFIRVHLDDVGDVPLGWALSKKAIGNMNDAIEDKIEPMLDCLGQPPS